MPLGDAAVMPLRAPRTLSGLGQHCGFIQCLEPLIRVQTPWSLQPGLASSSSR